MNRKKEDRISLLPDCLLLEIISRLELSTKQVIKTTSTISKRWQHLWTKLPTLNFDWKDDVPYGLYDDTYPSNYFSFIDKTLTQCPTDLNLNQFILRIINDSGVYTQPKSQVYSWIQHAISRNVQELDLMIDTRYREKFSYDHELFFNNSCVMSMNLSRCVFNPPNGAIRWDKLKCLFIDDGALDEDSMGKILSGSPCLETLELKYFYIDGCLAKSLLGKFSVEQLSCHTRIYKTFTNGDEGFLEDFGCVSMKLSRCLSNPPPNGWCNLNFLCIQYWKLDEDSIGNILSRSPCLETLELYCCYDVRRIDVASKSVKTLVLSDYGYNSIDTLEINAPYILSLIIEGTLDMEKILLLNVSSLVKVKLDYWCSSQIAEKLGRTLDDIEDEFLKGLLTNLGHVTEITLRNNCLEVSSRLKKKRGVQLVMNPQIDDRGVQLVMNPHIDDRGVQRVMNPQIDDIISGNFLNWCHGFYLFVIILLFSFWVAMVSKTGLLS